MGLDCFIDPDQRAWYVITRDNDLKGDQSKMWQEYPSFPDEAFKSLKTAIITQRICLRYESVVVYVRLKFLIYL